MKDLLIKFKMYGFFLFTRFVLYELFLRIVTQQIRNSYSQRSEDIIIDRLLGYKKKGFYIDVGANDPIRFSNTFRFYKRGWSGINIETNNSRFNKLCVASPKDINLNIGIGMSNQTLYFCTFLPDTLSTFSDIAAKKYIENGYQLVGKAKMKVMKLADVFAHYYNNRSIDFLSVDTEGYDLQVLKSNNWDKYRPKLICVEADKNDKKITQYLTGIGYNEIYSNGLNKIFVTTKNR